MVPVAANATVPQVHRADRRRGVPRGRTPRLGPTRHRGRRIGPAAGCRALNPRWSHPSVTIHRTGRHGQAVGFPVLSLQWNRPSATTQVAGQVVAVCRCRV